jgi:hypothetical protein
MPTDRPLPFEVSPEELQSNLSDHVQSVFDALESDFLVMPRGDGFVSSEAFARGYQSLVDATDTFAVLDPDRIFAAARRTPMTLVILRSVLGFTPPEWADVATVATGLEIDQGYARGLDRAIRRQPEREIGGTPLQEQRIRALIQAACEVLGEPPPEVEETEIHRLDKVDTADGLASLREAATEGVPYPSLLYERYLGRPFASHRDSVSELIGGMLEDKIERYLEEAGVPFYQTSRAEVIDGWDQNPDFFCPDQANPVAVIEAKLTQDDGTARDKVSRVIRLAEMRNRAEREGMPGFEVIACIAGRGFGVRKSDMGDLLQATRGKVFTLSQIDRLVDNTRIASLKKPQHP